MEGGIVILSDPDERCDTYYESHRVCDGPTLLKDPTTPVIRNTKSARPPQNVLMRVRLQTNHILLVYENLMGLFLLLVELQQSTNQLTHDTYGRMGLDVEVDPIDCNGIWSDWSECNGEREERTFRIKTLEEMVNGQPRYVKRRSSISRVSSMFFEIS